MNARVHVEYQWDQEEEGMPTGAYLPDDDEEDPQKAHDKMLNIYGAVVIKIIEGQETFKVFAMRIDCVDHGFVELCAMLGDALRNKGPASFSHPIEQTDSTFTIEVVDDTVLLTDDYYDYAKSIWQKKTFRFRLKEFSFELFAAAGRFYNKVCEKLGSRGKSLMSPFKSSIDTSERELVKLLDNR